MARIIFLCMLFVLVGCDQIGNKVAQTVYKGTLKGVEACLAENKSSLVSEEDVRNRCVDAHKKGVYVDGTDGRSAFLSAKPDSVIRIKPAHGTWLNNSNSSIITQVEVAGMVYDKAGKEFSGKAVKKGLWIMPGEAIDIVFDVQIPDMPKGIGKNCDGGPYENCMTFGRFNFWGIKFTVN